MSVGMGDVVGGGPRTCGEHLHVVIGHFIIYPVGAMEGVDVLGDDLHIVGCHYDLPVVGYQV